MLKILHFDISQKVEKRKCIGPELTFLSTGEAKPIAKAYPPYRYVLKITVLGLKIMSLSMETPSPTRSKATARTAGMVSSLSTRLGNGNTHNTGVNPI